MKSNTEILKSRCPDCKGDVLPNYKNRPWLGKCIECHREVAIGKRPIVELCINYTTTGWPTFKPLCNMNHKASLRCHTFNTCSDYKPSEL